MVVECDREGRRGGRERMAEREEGEKEGRGIEGKIESDKVAEREGSKRRGRVTKKMKEIKREGWRAEGERERDGGQRGREREGIRIKK